MFVEIRDDRTWTGKMDRQSNAGQTTNYVLCLLAIALIGSSVVGWRMITVLERRRVEEQESARRFNAELVEAVHSLAENAGVLTSSDLCPVRFRLRSTDLHTSVPPARSATGELFLRGDDGQFRSRNTVSSKPSGTLDFGLQEPGRYRLLLSSADGMTLEHEFEVLPGVPVDRLVRCPAGDPNGTLSSVAIDWPDELSHVRMAAVSRMRPAELELDGWTWSAAARHADELMWSQNTGFIEADARVAEQVGPCVLPELGDTESQVPMYCRHWEISEIAFVLLNDAETPPGARVLGTARYGDKDSMEPESLVNLDCNGPVWTTSEPAPQLEVVKELLPLKLPQNVIEQLRDAIGDSIDGSVIVGSDSSERPESHVDRRESPGNGSGALPHQPRGFRVRLSDAWARFDGSR